MRKCPKCKNQDVEVWYDGFSIVGDGLPDERIEQCKIDWYVKPEISFDTLRHIYCGTCEIEETKWMRVEYKLSEGLKLRD